MKENPFKDEGITQTKRCFICEAFVEEWAKTTTNDGRVLGICGECADMTNDISAGEQGG